MAAALGWLEGSGVAAGGLVAQAVALVGLTVALRYVALVADAQPRPALFYIRKRRYPSTPLTTCTVRTNQSSPGGADAGHSRRGRRVAGHLSQGAELGYRTIAVDQRGTAPGVALADEHLPISTREPGLSRPRWAAGQTLAESGALRHRAADPASWRIGWTAVRLTESATRASVDKSYFRRLCDELAVPSVGGRRRRPRPRPVGP